MTAESELYRRALRLTVIALVVIAALGAGVGVLVAGTPGVVAALVGAGVAALGAVPTQVAMIVGHTRPPHVLAGIVGFSWLGKMAIILIALLVLRDIESFHRAMFAATMVTGLFATLAIDVATLRRARVPNVDPGT